MRTFNVHGGSRPNERNWFARQHLQQERGKRPVKVTGEIVRDTGKAYQVRFTVTAGGKDCELLSWIPISLIEHRSTFNDAERGFSVSTLTIPQWLAKERGLDYEEVD